MSNNPYADNFASGGYFYNPLRRDLTMIKGDTLSFGFQVQGLKGQLPSSIVLTCRETIEAVSPLFEISLSDTIKYRSYDEDNDILTYTVRIPPHKTAALALGRFYYDLELQVNNDVITLMKGRLTLDYEITSGDTPAPPTYEDGDPVEYPIDVQIGVIKYYTEEYISDIAQGILDINGAEDTYTTQEMSSALADILSDINDIRSALNTEAGTSLTIALSDIAAAILALDGNNISY